MAGSGRRAEVRFDVLKSNLGPGAGALENFSGYSPGRRSVLSVKQDLYAALFLLNLHALVSQEVKSQVAENCQQRQYNYQVNRAAGPPRRTVKLYL